MAYRVDVAKAEVYIAETEEDLDVEGMHNTIHPFLKAREMAATFLYLRALGLSDSEAEMIMELSAEIIRGK